VEEDIVGGDEVVVEEDYLFFEENPEHFFAS